MNRSRCPVHPAGAPREAFRPGQNRWFGWDGSVIDMGDKAGGVVFADGGASGLAEEPPFEHYRTASATDTLWKVSRTALRRVSDLGTR